ncbi:MAG: aminotransferase class I/II-fold pyridoxal phosphate-dependent enzyme [Microcystis aeruginosa Ma_MB_F_20061100_S20]|uniref:Aminotransferase class I/II-fold pyridoxal phosphate-dependent enzyme n=1 Tax=Microcystis aeruginosa Ma_MB_F_20061100_S20D TaxID=2486253 RepID=A0A552EID7_MICAE|nr:MAG: aminotransferase class I/II-fold pyridoxal phosphate-dependent enzyme [Microcystis aeruginosa Ma_MB_F_20061100_S20D]TRU38262.1 MAG: aminotransferase class I/II-fold pyridoxal phosphate-dependent enzyme [Microcystis aeruginosa Ma_MB_F_20061100_S20]
MAMKTTFPFTRIIKDLPALVPFVSIKTMERSKGYSIKLRLGANESRFGISPLAREAMREAIEDISLYGDPESYDLRTAIANLYKIDRDNIVVGSGIDDLLGLVARTFIEPGQKTVMSKGSYPTFNYHVVGYDGQMLHVPYQDFHNDPEALVKMAKIADARIIYLVNPDNPTGTYLPAKKIRRAIEQLPPQCMLLLDEAYIDFAPATALLPVKPLHPEVIRLRTFSKGHGLAGARIGYAIADPAIIAAFEKIRLHYGVNAVAQAGALASLQDTDFLLAVIAEVEAGRNEYANLAKELGLSTLPSATNFVAIDMGSQERAHAMVDKLFELGVFIRMPSADPLNRYIRVTVGTPQERWEFSRIFRKVYLQE